MLHPQFNYPTNANLPNVRLPDNMTSIAPSFINSTRIAARNTNFSPSSTSSTSICKRSAGRFLRRRPIPPTRPFVPDVAAFLALYGRGLKEFNSKIPSWEKLFTMTGSDLAAANCNPPKLRKYLMRVREQFRQGIVGVGGDFKHVHENKGWLQVVRVRKEDKLLPAQPEEAEARSYARNLGILGTLPALYSAGTKELVVNVPHDADQPPEPQEQWAPVAKVKWESAPKTLIASGIKAAPNQDGRRAFIEIQEGLWETSPGKKIDGGERRKAEVRAKRRAQENKLKKS